MINSDHPYVVHTLKIPKETLPAATEQQRGLTLEQSEVGRRFNGELCQVQIKLLKK